MMREMPTFRPEYRAIVPGRAMRQMLTLRPDHTAIVPAAYRVDAYYLIIDVIGNADGWEFQLIDTLPGCGGPVGRCYGYDALQSFMELYIAGVRGIARQINHYGYPYSCPAGS